MWLVSASLLLLCCKDKVRRSIFSCSPTSVKFQLSNEHRVTRQEVKQPCAGMAEEETESKLDVTPRATTVACGQCSLPTVIPEVPMYGPYNVRDLEAGKVYKWCRYCILLVLFTLTTFSCGLSRTQPFCDG